MNDNMAQPPTAGNDYPLVLPYSSIASPSTGAGVVGAEVVGAGVVGAGVVGAGVVGAGVVGAGVVGAGVVGAGVSTVEHVVQRRNKVDWSTAPGGASERVRVLATVRQTGGQVLVG